ncbi:YaeF family permuted papain-like enzyme [Escherichia coli]
MKALSPNNQKRNNDLYLKPGDLLFSSSLRVTSFGIRVFSTSSVSHVAIFLGDNNVAEATGAGVQIVSLKKAMKHSDKLSSCESRIYPQQATDITAFANKIKDSGYNYRGIVEFIPFMVTRQMCSLNPFSEDFRQSASAGLAKAQLSSVRRGQKSWFCSEFVTDAFAKAGHPLTLAQSGWISPADLMHMRIGDVSAFKPETQLQYVGHLKPGIISRRVALLG